jgi:alpha-tubulin suppressor-like RCC1 family protein
VAGGLRFHQISAGLYSTCGVTTDYVAYCWGANYSGVLGDGTQTHHPAPAPVVAGGRRFSRIDIGNNHTCAVSYPENRAYCWGNNSSGQLGDGSLTQRNSQVAVAGGLSFREVSVGDYHTCGVTTGNQAYCWGSNDFGEIGDSTEARRRLTPTKVAGARQFKQLDTGARYACAVTTAERAYCWGDGRQGQIGNGKAYLSFWPRAVAGGLSFDRVTAGSRHTCGETTSDKAYCWGIGAMGRLGNGGNTGSLSPVAVAGGLSFLQLSAGGDHTCGKSSTGAGYCWGYNFFAQLGDGTNTDRWTPAPVAAPSS